MSNVSTKYSTAAGQNTKLGNLSLAENQTRYKDLNDLFRQIMADARSESNEVRSLIASAKSAAATAQSAATAARGEANEANSRISGILTSVTTAVSTAEAAENAAEAAATSASSAATAATQAVSGISALQTTVSGLQSDTSSLSNRVTTLENASAEASGTSLVDGTTIEYLDGDLTAVDVAVDGILSDPASGRGQIGRTAVKTGVDMNSLVADGWYAVGGTGATGMPTGVTSGVIRTSSAYAEGTLVQCFWTGDSTACRAFIRWFDGTNWSDWLEQMSASGLGNGLTVENGVVSVDFADVIPEVAEGDEGKVLSSEGVWVDRVTQEELDAVASDIAQLVESVANLTTQIEAVQANAVVPPDGVTIAETDGTLSVPEYFGATAEEDGIAGLVPPAEAGQEDYVLKGDGSWQALDIGVSDFSGATEEADGEAGLVPAPQIAEADLFLKGDGTWGDPTEVLAEQIEALVQQYATEASSGIASTGDLTAMTAADVDWIVLGVPAPEPEPEPEPAEPEEPSEEEGEQTEEQEGE